MTGCRSSFVHTFSQTDFALRSCAAFGSAGPRLVQKLRARVLRTNLEDARADVSGPQLHHADSNTVWFTTRRVALKAMRTQVAFFPRPRLSISPSMSTHAVRAHVACLQKVPSVRRTKWVLAVNGVNRRAFTDRRAVFFGTPGCAHLSRVSMRRALRGPPLCFYLSTSPPSQTRTGWHKWRIDRSAGARIYRGSAAHLLLDKWHSSTRARTVSPHC